MAYPSDEDIIKLLNNDSIQNAENLTGKEADSDEPTMELGFVMNLYDNITKEKALKSIGDATFSMDWTAYCELIETFGFGLMIEEFSPNGGDSLRIYYHEKDGLLLKTDSYLGDRNSAKVYYNWKPNTKPKKEWKDTDVAELVNFHDVTSSGCLRNAGPKIPDDLVWVGDHDAREALGFNLKRLREKGEFLPKWKGRPYLSLMGYWEKDDIEEYDSIREDKIKKLPQWVQENIKGML